jgi:hypothetical protein
LPEASGIEGTISDELFADSVSGISLTGGVVRLDLASVLPTEKDEKNQPKPIFRQHIVMPGEGFVQSFALMAQVMQQLEKTASSKNAPAEGDKPAADVRVRSPNFK